VTSLTVLATELHPVPYLERSIEEQDDARHQRGQQVLEREAHRHGHGAAHRQQQLIGEVEDAGGHQHRSQDDDGEAGDGRGLLEQQAVAGEALPQGVEEAHQHARADDRGQHHQQGVGDAVQHHEAQQVGGLGSVHGA
jgi:hypothetical protein